jgi:hypothetical protein
MWLLLFALYFIEAGHAAAGFLLTQSASPPAKSEAEPVTVIQAYKNGLVGVRAANPDVHLNVGRDPTAPDGTVLMVEYPAPTGPLGARFHFRSGPRKR